MGMEIPATKAGQGEEENELSRETARSVSFSTDTEEIGAMKEDEEEETEEETEEEAEEDEDDGEIVEAAKGSEQHEGQQQERTTDEARELRALKARPSVLIVGPPAVGKRSILNRLVARVRSMKVTSETGSTGHGGVIGKVWRERGAYACASVESYCCERPNPILQLFYLAIIGGTYFSISATSLQYILGYVGPWHRYTGQGAVLFGIFLFLMTSFCDPGTINAATLQQHISVFPYDGIIYHEKDCFTCKIPRPARSKHCSICNRCIARFDHHCGWMNNCIGEKNLRYFLGFLIWHVFLCWYGVYLLGAILLGEIEERSVLRTIYFYYGTAARDVYPQLLQWLLIFYSTQVLMMIFLSVVSLLLVSFSGYHVYLVVMNTTTNETYKWDDHQRWQADLAWQKILAEESEKSGHRNAEVASKAVRKGGLLGFFRRSHTTLPPKPKPSSFKKDNLYNRGVLINAAEVLYPLSSRTRFLPSRQTKKD